MRRGANRGHLGQYNARIVIHALRRLGSASQGEIAEATGLSIAGVSTIVRGLIADGLLEEVRSESSGMGRPRTIIGIAPDVALGVGVHIDPALLTTALVDLRGTPLEILHDREIDSGDPAAALDATERLVARALEGAPAESQVVGLGLAVPGRISTDAGGIVDSVWLPRWNDVPLREDLASRTGLPVRILKDTHAAVIGELWVRGRDLVEATTVFVYLGIGTGFGLAVAGEAVAGTSGNAGQGGRLFEALTGSLGTDPDLPTAHDPTQLVASAHARGLLAGPVPSRGDVLAVDREFRELCTMPGAHPLLEAAADRIAHAAGIAADLLDADYVVLGGPYAQLLREIHLPRALAVLSPSAPGGRPGVDVVASVQGADAGALGAASAVLDAEYAPRTPTGPGAGD
jgi:predicted NBD/HSP70 family sugar kinase